jgi:hypothetical protein
MQMDVVARQEDRLRQRSTKRKLAARRDFLEASTLLLEEVGANPQFQALSTDDPLRASVLRLMKATGRAEGDSQLIQALCDSGPECASRFTDRTRSLLMLIELHSFDPYPPHTQWSRAAHKDAIRQLVDLMPEVTIDDSRLVKSSFDRAMRRLMLRTTNWWKVLGLALAGGVVGGIPLFFAAPLIGAAVGGAMGLSGAAATSAGLAALGGGSIATGGFGMAGGTAILVSSGAVVGSATGSTGAYFSSLARGKMVVDAIKLQILLEVLSKTDGEEELQKFAVMSLHEQLADLETLLEDLTAKLKETGKENRDLHHQLKRERAENEILKAVYQQTLQVAA